MTVLLSAIILSWMMSVATSLSSSHYTPINNYYAPSEEYQKNIFKACINPTPTRVYIFFSDNETSNNIYCIKTNWVVLHQKKIRTSLKKHGMHIIDKNPRDKCGWIQNKNYEWVHDEVMFYGNMTDDMDVAAYTATKQNCAIEWALIFIWAWGPIAIAMIAGIIVAIRESLHSHKRMHANGLLG
jgi:hypothetical protein